MTEHLMGQVWARLRLMVAQGVGTLMGAEYVQVRVLDSEVLPKVRRVEPYGFSYRPKTGAEVYMVFPAGDRAQGIALVVGDRRYQMTLVEGEVALHDDDGNYVQIARGGVINVKAKTKVYANTPLFEVTGDVKIGGNLQVAGATTSDGSFFHNGKNVGAPHKHTSGSPGQPTSGVN